MSTDIEKVIYSMIKVSKYYDKDPVLKDISLSYFYGAKIGVLGLNGAGKSSLLKALYADIPLLNGRASVAGFPVHEIKSKQVPFLRRKLGIIFQQFNLLPYGSLLKNVLLPLQFSAARWRRASTNGPPEDEARRLRAESELTEFRTVQLLRGALTHEPQMRQSPCRIITRRLRDGAISSPS